MLILECSMPHLLLNTENYYFQIIQKISTQNSTFKKCPYIQIHTTTQVHTPNSEFAFVKMFVM